MAEKLNGLLLYRDSDKLRFYEKKEDPKDLYRSAYRKDYARLLHSAAFRRLQGKTQLFPNNESDFSRNRLTHSLEVAQIAKSIALKINHDHLSGMPQDQQINLELVEIAGLAHDIGHPPFGHNGELALDEHMRSDAGGFEGNAQTLRILCRLEKKETLTRTPEDEPILVEGGKDNRCGLNLTMRGLAAVLKYDYEIPMLKENRKAEFEKEAPKGFYLSERQFVERIKKEVLGISTLPSDLKFKTLECQIMDIADDIAYSTYDIEDAFKAKFTNPLALLSEKEEFYEDLAEKIQKSINEQERYKTLSKKEKTFDAQEALDRLEKIFREIFETEITENFIIASNSYRTSLQTATNGYYRTRLTAQLIGEFIDGVRFEINREFPALSKVYLDIETFKRVELLKKLAHLLLIKSPMLKIAESRGKEIVSKIFERLDEKDGSALLPPDFQYMHQCFKDNNNLSSSPDSLSRDKYSWMISLMVGLS